MIKHFILLILFFITSCARENRIPVESIELAKGLYRLTIQGINAVALIDSNGNALLSDNFKDIHSKALQGELRRLGCKRIAYMINTHFHGDHCGGNKTINEGVIISHLNTRKSLESDHRSVFWQDTSRAFPPKALPHITLTDKMTIHFADEEIELIPFPGGHTNSDIAVYFKNSKVMHVSDLLFSIGFPAIDSERGGNVFRFAENLKTIIEQYPDDITFVAGHGREYSNLELREYHDMIESSANIVRAAMKDGRDLQQVKQGKLLDKWSRHSNGYFSCDDWAEIVYYSLQWADTLGEFFHLNNLKGNYIDNTIPETEPLIFAPGVITTQAHEGCSGFNKEMDRFYFQRWEGIIPSLFVTKYNQGKWSVPELLKTTFEAPIYDFSISPAGNKLVFSSSEQIARHGIEQIGHNIFFLENESGTWKLNSSLPDSGINTTYHDSYPCLSENGNLYFFSNRPGGYGKTDIYYSEYKDGKYNTPVNLGEIINTMYDEWDPFVAPDEGYMIFCSKKPSGLGEDDLYVSFKIDNSWSVPISLGSKINTPFSENRPTVTPDGKFLFFTRNLYGCRDIYWVSAKIIEELKPKK